VRVSRQALATWIADEVAGNRHGHYDWGAAHG
jgi:hypothetical protein